MKRNHLFVRSICFVFCGIGLASITEAQNDTLQQPRKFDHQQFQQSNREQDQIIAPVNHVGNGHVDLSPCFTMLIADVEVPAQESGPLIAVGVKEGQMVQQGQELARIDDSLAILRLDTARTKLETASDKANNDLDIRAAQNALQLAERERKTNYGIYSKGALPKQDYDRSVLQSKQAALQVEQARRDMESATKEAQVESYNVRAQTDSIQRHLITAPLQGNVMQLHKEKGEWVNAGDNVMRIARLDQLYVSGLLDSSLFDPHEVEGQRVTVAVQMARGQVVEFQGRITFVALEKNSSKFYSVRAEVENRAENNRWLLLANEEVSMRIHLEKKDVAQHPQYQEQPVDGKFKR